MRTTRAPLAILVLLLAGLLGGCFLLSNRPPEALFDVVYDTVPTDPMVVVLDASPSTDPNGDAIVAYSWVFGDDVTILTPPDFTTQVATAAVAVPTLVVRYPVEGTYSLTLVVRDEQGASSSPFSRTITLPNVSVDPMP